MMRSLGWVLIGGCALLVSGCVSPEQQRAMDRQKCGDFGFVPGTNAFAHCVMTVTQQREAQEAAGLREWEEKLAREQQPHDDDDHHHHHDDDHNWDHHHDDQHDDDPRCTTINSQFGNTMTTRQECHSFGM